MSEPRGMRCLQCGYPLEHLPEHRCPECGRAFDPHDCGTWTRFRHDSSARGLFAIMLGSAAALVVSSAGLAVDWTANAPVLRGLLGALHGLGILGEAGVLVLGVRGLRRGERDPDGLRRVMCLAGFVLVSCVGIPAGFGGLWVVVRGC